MLTSTGTVVNWEAAGGGGGGDFSGPGSATDNAVVRFNGTGGKTGQNSGVTIDDSNNATGFANLTLSGELDAATLDISGNADIDGTTNLDAVDIDGAVQIDSTVTVGVDDTGHDVKFFGATSGKYMEWDESADTLNVVGNAGVGIARTEGTLHVHTASAGSVTANTIADDLVVESNGNMGISLLGPDANDKYIYFGSPSTNNIASIGASYNSGDEYLFFTTVGSERMRIDDSGRVDIGTAGATVSSSADKLVVNDGANAGMTIYSTGTSSGQMKLSLTNAEGADAGAAMIYSNSDDALFFNVNGANERMRINSAGALFINDTANSYSANTGMTVNVGAQSGATMAFKSNTSHDMTSIVEADTYGDIIERVGEGGVMLRGFIDTGNDNVAIEMLGYVEAEITTKSASGHGVIRLRGATSNGSGGANTMGSNANVVTVNDSNGTVWICDSDGDVHYDGTTNASAWDDHDDVGLLGTFRNLTTSNKAQDVFGEFVSENAKVLHDTGVITMNDDGHHFVSTKGLNALIIDTIRQEGQKWREVVGEYQDKIAALESRLLRLEA